MAERVFINDLTPITDIQNNSMMLVDQNGYKKMYYSDFVLDIANTLRSEHDNDWNAQVLDGTRVDVENPLNRDTLIYNSSTQQFENRKITSTDIDWSTVDVNEHRFLQVDSSGNIVTANVQLPSLRMDNSYSAGYFLRVKSDGEQIEAVEFDPNEFTINAQTLEGNNVADLDVRYMRGQNNLSEVANKATSRSNLEVLSEIESDSRYVAKSQNLNDLPNKATAFNNIKQLASTSYQGVIEIATSPEVQDGVRDDVAVVPSTLKDNYYNKSITDGRYLQRANNLTDVNNLNAARANLDVFSRTESDSRYLQKGLNLSELTSKEVSRNNLEVYSKSYIDTFTLNPLNNLNDVDNVGLARNNLNVYDKNYIDDMFNDVNSVPVGTIITVPTNSVPNGYIKCNGATLNASTYPELFQVLGRLYGGSASNNTFKVPDLRGEFIRGWDDGKGVDSGRMIGTTQSHSMQSHNHYLPTGAGLTWNRPNDRYALPDNIWAASNINTGSTNGMTGGNTTYPNPNFDNPLYPEFQDHSIVGSIGTFSHETRPRNVAMMYCIKY